MASGTQFSDGDILGQRFHRPREIPGESNLTMAFIWAGSFRYLRVVVCRDYCCAGVDPIG